MNWAIISGFFLLSTIKFMFTPLGGPAAGLTFFETYFACVAGGSFGAAVFFFSGNYFINRAEAKYHAQKEKFLLDGTPYKVKKRFTKMNRFIIKLRLKLGIVGISFFIPFLLSVPIGSIITAKFYGDDRRTYPLIVLGMFVNGLATTGLSFLLFS
ncbi:MAG: hypothetical protein ACI865_000866 [Flavobacteriaceae bacterium]|jgi:hypothetical protein